jgi:tRNA dimethylallyltransferase
MQQLNNKKLLVILGPTASGKSDLAIKLAKLFNGEIISADSRQIYQGMDIGTGKVKKDTEYTILNTEYYSNDIRHHLLNIKEPNKPFSVAQYQKLAFKTIKNIQNRGKLPILCGGTGLYISSVIENWQFPKVPPQQELRKELEKKSVKELFKIYQKLDPQGAKFIARKNKRRLIRAIEVCKDQQQPFWQQRKKAKPLFDTLVIGINPVREKISNGVKLPQEELKRRIAKRVEKMIKMGLETEVKTLVKKYGWVPALQSIGYQEWKAYFENKIKKKEVQDLIELHTLQYSKRQMTWFKKMKGVKWIEKPKQAKTIVKNWLESNNK